MEETFPGVFFGNRVAVSHLLNHYATRQQQPNLFTLEAREHASMDWNRATCTASLCPDSLHTPRYRLLPMWLRHGSVALAASAPLELGSKGNAPSPARLTIANFDRVCHDKVRI